MRTKEQYYQDTLKNREVLNNPQNINCPCQKELCEWHGDCKKCVALHRYHSDHLPVCMTPIIKDKIVALAHHIELITLDKEPTPLEYRKYIKEMDEREC